MPTPHWNAKASQNAASGYALVGMVTFVGKWWTEVRKPSVEDVAKHVDALAWMGLRHLPKRPSLKVQQGG